jgi:ABC-type glycerol-3-phosphate transport system substrate-binding protein
MKTKRIFALLLAALMIVGLFAGCSKDGTKDPGKTDSSGSLIDQTKPSQTTAKYAYKADYLDLTMPDGVQYLNQICAAGTTLYASVGIQGEEIVNTDPTTGETWSYYNTRLSMLTIDPDTGTCTELTNLDLPQVPEGAEGSVDCYNMIGSDDGTLWMLVNVYATQYELPDDFDPNTDSKWNYPSTDINGSYLMHIAADGSTIASLDLSDTNNEDNEDGMSGNLSSFAVDAAGNLYVSDYNNIYVLDAEGNVQFKLDGSQYNGSLCRLNAQQVGVMWYNYTDDVNASDENGQYFVPIDLETKDWGEKVKLPSNVWSIFPGDDAYDFYYAYNNNIYGYAAKTDTKEKLVDWLACDVDTNNMSGYAMLSDSRVAALMQDWSTDPTTYQLIVLHRVDASEIKEKKVLTLACMYLDWNLRSMIVEYNKTNDEYRINVVDYSEYATDDDYNAGVTKLTTEIISGSVPDIFLTSNLPIDKYAAKGVIADLNTFMDGGNGLSRDYFVPQVMSALEKDGKLYELPTSFSVQTAYALSSIASQYDTWNVAAVQDAMTQLQEGATVFSNGWTKNTALSNCLSRNLSAFVDWTTGKCEFDSEAFQQLLAFCNSFPAETSDGDGAIAYASSADIAVDDAMWDSDATRITNGKQLMSTIGMYSFDSYIWNVYAIRDKITFTGYPTEDGSGSSFELQMPMAISSVTKYPDAAWDFVCSIIKKMNTIDENNYYYGFPISQAAFDAEMTDIMTEQYQLDEKGEQVDWDGDGEPDKAIRGSYETMENGETVYKDVYALTQEDIDQILGVINSTRSVYDYDQEILDIITDEVAAYFAGDKDVQTTANMIQSRVNLYVQEQR